MEPLTRRQQDILHYIGDVAGSRDRAPTLAEIAAAFGMSPPGAFKHVRALARKGCLVVSPGLHRGIRLKGGRRRWKVQGALRGDFDRRIGAKLAGETDLRRIFDVVAGDVRTWLDVERAELFVHDPAHRMLRDAGFYGAGSPLSAPVQTVRGNEKAPEEIRRSRPEGRSHNSSSSISDPGAGLAAGALRRRKPAVAGGLAAVPVPASGRVAGVLVLTDRRAGRAFDETRLARAAMAAAALGLAIEQAALGEELRRRIRLQAALAALCRTVNAVRDFQTVAREVHAIVRGLVDADYFEITVHDSDRWWVLLESDTVDGVTKANDVPHVVDPVDNPGLRAIRTRPYYILHRTPAEIARLEGAGRAASADGWNPVGHVGRRSRSILYVPLQTGGDVIGLLSAQSYRYDAYSATAAEDLILVGEYIGLALRNAWRMRGEWLRLEAARGTLRRLEAIRDRLRRAASDCPPAARAEIETAADELAAVRPSPA